MQLRLENANFIWCLVPIAILCARVWYLQTRRRIRLSKPRFFMMVLALCLCVFGLCRPQGGTHVTSSVGRTSNIFIALDISRSMLVQDTLPSRIQFATTFVQKLLPSLAGARFALFPFTLDGYVQVPLTSDVLAVLDLLASLTPSIITLQGTDLSQSMDTLLTRILEAEDRIKTRGGDWSGAQVLLLSDGESHVELRKKTFEEYRSKRIPIFTIVTGTPTGGTVPWDPRTANPREPASRTVVSKADPNSLRTIAELSGGRFFQGSFDSLDPLRNQLHRAMQMGKLTTHFRIEREFFPHCFFFALCLLVIFFLQERWEYAIRSFLLFILFGSSPLFADNVKEAIQKYNEALQMVKAQDLKGAIERFQEAAYLSDNKEVQKKSLYSLGNALLKSGEPTQALQAYQQAFDTLTGNSSFDNEANQRISDNMVLAAKVEEKMKEEAKKNQKGKGDEEGDQRGEAKDPKGPQKFESQSMDETMKKKFYDLVSSEERQGLQRTMDRRNRNSNQTSSKPW